LLKFKVHLFENIYEKLGCYVALILFIEQKMIEFRILECIKAKIPLDLLDKVLTANALFE